MYAHFSLALVSEKAFLKYIQDTGHGMSVMTSDWLMYYDEMRGI
jgi:hypothetical protein